MLLLTWLPLSMHSRTQPREWCHPQRVSIPTTSNPIKIITHRHAQVILDFVKLTINTINHKGHGTGRFVHGLQSVTGSKNFQRLEDFTGHLAVPTQRHRGFYLALVQCLGRYVTLAADNNLCLLME